MWLAVVCHGEARRCRHEHHNIIAEVIRTNTILRLPGNEPNRYYHMIMVSSVCETDRQSITVLD